MFEKVGKRGIEIPSHQLCWNPPGWGSVQIDPSIWPGSQLAMIVGIRPGGFIPFHRDNPAAENGLEVTLHRYHLVLATNAKCWNYHDSTWQQLEEGFVYQMDPTLEHASINLGDSIRLHLVVDLLTELS